MKTDPTWISAQQLKTLTPSAPVLDWLCDTNSMTKRVKALSPDTFRLELAGQEWETPNEADIHILNLPNKEHILQREIIMYHGSAPCLYGCSLLPRKTLSGRESVLGQLGSRSIGHVLFSHANMTRSSPEFTQLHSEHSLFIKATRLLHQPPKTLWARRSVFHVAEKPLLIYEVLLPALFEYP